MYNGKELNTDFDLNWSDYAARYYDAAIGRFTSQDPHADSYTPLTPYSYVANNPIIYIDPDGRDLYLFYSVKSEQKGETAAFWNAALTRAADLLASDEYDSKEDKFIARQISDLGKLKEDVEGQIEEHSPKFGKTKEFGIWSHSGFDGPRGSVKASKNALEEGSFQISMEEGWGSIDFNWVEDGAVCGFYGCNSGRSKFGTNESFNQRVSKLDNFKDVDVLGQIKSSYPSKSRKSRNIDSNIRNDIHIGKTYFVASKRLFVVRQYFKGTAYPLSVYKNGTRQWSRYQPK